MTMQSRIGQAFCGQVKVSPFKGGFGVSTPFMDRHGDHIGYYIIGPDREGKYRFIDDALTVALFESEGATLDAETRLVAFNEIMYLYGAAYDEALGELYINGVKNDDIERRSLDFTAMMLRLQDMYLLTHERTKNTFLEDVANRLNDLKIEGLSIETGTPVYKDLVDVIPDYVLRRTGAIRPVALFVVAQENKLWQAMHLKLVAEHEAHQPVSVVALLQSDRTGSAGARAKASNRLDALPQWEHDEVAALQRVVRELDVPMQAIY